MYKLQNRILTGMLSVAMMVCSIPGSVVLAASKDAEGKPQLITDYDMTLTEDGKLKDNAGSHDGKMAALSEQNIDENGALVFTGDKSQYVELPEGTFGEDESFTVEIKFNTSQKAYAWIYNIGAKSADDVADYVCLNPIRANGDAVFELRQNAGERRNVIQNGGVKPGEDTWATMVFHDDKKAEFYIDGERIGSVSHGCSVQTIIQNGKNGDCIGYLGKSLFHLDPGYIGTISNFRVYDTSLTADQVWKNYAKENLADQVKADMDMQELTIETGRVSEDIELPSVGKNGALIQWQSSDPAVISETGAVIKPEDADQEVTLTASVTYGESTSEKEFKFTVISDATIVSEAEKNLKIENADPVMGNLTLLTRLDGSDIAWKSSKPEIITDKAKVNPGYADTPAGVVTRGDQDEEVTLTATITSGEKTAAKEFNLTVKQKAEKKEYAAYLYVHFNELIPGTSLQQIYFGVSKDGLQWTALNDNQPVLVPEVGDEGVRDPYIIRSAEGDKFYLLATDLDIHHQKYGGDWGKMATYGSNSLVIWESTDLVNWTGGDLFPVAQDFGTGCAWAPAAVYDQTTGEYLVFWSGNLMPLGEPDHGYLWASKTRDFVHFTEPELYSRPEVSSLDADIYWNEDTGKYYRVVKNLQNGVIYLESSDKLLDYSDNAPTYTTIGGRQFVSRGTHFEKIENSEGEESLEWYSAHGRNNAHEGPTTFKLNGENRWCIFVDEFGGNSPRGYIPFFTDDLDKPNSVKIAPDDSYTLTDGAKHGSVIPITQEEYNALMEKWGVQNENYSKEQEEPILMYDFEEEAEAGVVKDKSNHNDGTLFGKAEYRYDEEKKSQVLYLDGSNGTYAELPQGLLDGLDHLTVSMDIKAETTGEWHFDFTTGQDDSRYMFLRVRDNEVRNAITARKGPLEKEVRVGGAGFLNKWIHVTAVMDNHKMYLYVDGREVARSSGIGIRSISELGKNLRTYLGKSFYEDPYFKGSYDNVKIFNRALDAEEVLKDYTTVKFYTVTYRAGEGGSIDGKAVQTVGLGTPTEPVTAVPDEGYEFIKWSDGKTNAVRSDTLKDNLIITAQFKKISTPEEDPGKNPGEDPGKNPGEDPDKNPGEDPGNNPGEDPGKNPGTDPGQIKISINDARVKAIADQIFTGKELTPSITVTCNGKTLTAGKDYTVSYSKNTNIGTAAVQITGTGTYEGTISTSFKITVKKNRVYTTGNYKYKITNANTSGKGTVMLTGLKSASLKKKLRSITIGDTVKIGGKSFKVTEIGASAFAGCTKATSATIGKNVAKIGSKAFYNDKKLKKVTIKGNNLKSIGKNAFMNIYKKGTVKVPSKKLKTYKKLLNKKVISGSVKITAK